MIGFNHAITGVVIGATAPGGLVAPLALLSHFAMDALPHFGRSDTFKPYNKAFKLLLLFDAIMCCGVLLVGLHFIAEKTTAIIMGVFFAALPDFLWLIEGKISALKSYFKFAKAIQRHESPEGWTYEAVFFALMVVLFTLVV